MNEKIACCLIIRDDASTLRELLESVRPHVDELCICDTGSTDDSPAIAREYADKFEVFIGCNDPKTGLIEDFALARNKSWSMAESRVALWLDGDDVLLGGEHLRPLVERTPADAAYIWMMRYDYAANTEQDRERMVFPRHKFAWQTPVHEVLLAQPPHDSEVRVAHVAELEPRIRVRHRQTESTKVREPGRNLRILKKYLATAGEGDPRAMYYCGQEYACQGDMGNAMRLLRRFIEIGGWDEERCLALLTMAQLQQTVGDHQAAVEWAVKAMLEKSWPEPYFVLARSYYQLAMSGVDIEKNFRRSVHFALNGLAGNGVTDGAILLSRNPQSRRDIYEYLNVCLGRLGDLDGAIKACEDGLALNPENTDLKANLAEYQNHRSRRRIVVEAELLRERGGQSGISADQFAVIELALTSKVSIGLTGEDGMPLPGTAPAASSPAVARVPAEPLPEPAPGKLRIVFYVGHGLEAWSPKTIEETGQGGSETMAWEMARRLARRGHAVRLYGHLSPAMEGVYNGVEYLDASRFHGVKCDVLVASRNPAAVDDVHGCEARARVLWVHDVHCGEALNMPRFLRFDRVLVLSEWHKEFFCGCYGGIDKSKVVVTRNGIDLEMFSDARLEAEMAGDVKRAAAQGYSLVKRNPHRAIYSSSPDRGLLTAVECWPEVRRAVPDAELHVFYGFYNWERVAELTGDQDQLRNINHLKALIRATPGVVLRDRVPPKQLALEMLQAGVWAYPTWFTETSCITAMQAQAAGLRIVTSPIAALVETCGDTAVFIKGKGAEGEWWRQAEYKRAWTSGVAVAMLEDDSEWKYSRADIAKAAKRFDLETLADEWDRDLAALVKQVETDVVPRFETEAAE